MITPNGYTKDPQVLPEGIVITWSKDMIMLKGGMLKFIRYFEIVMKDESNVWLQKSRNRPNERFEPFIQYVYIIISGRIQYRLFYGGYELGNTLINVPGSGESFARVESISWPRIICAGPFLKAPYRINQKGFQGFRYCTKLF